MDTSPSDSHLTAAYISWFWPEQHWQTKSVFQITSTVTHNGQVGLNNGNSTGILYFGKTESVTLVQKSLVSHLDETSDLGRVNTFQTPLKNKAPSNLKSQLRLVKKIMKPNRQKPHA